jgi:hypothetical protein
MRNNWKKRKRNHTVSLSSIGRAYRHSFQKFVFMSVHASLCMSVRPLFVLDKFLTSLWLCMGYKGCRLMWHIYCLVVFAHPLLMSALRKVDHAVLLTAIVLICPYIFEVYLGLKVSSLVWFVFSSTIRRIIELMQSPICRRRRRRPCG